MRIQKKFLLDMIIIGKTYEFVYSEFRMLNHLLSKQKETSRRFLNMTVARVVAVSPQMRLVQDNPNSVRSAAHVISLLQSVVTFCYLSLFICQYLILVEEAVLLSQNNSFRIWIQLRVFRVQDLNPDRDPFHGTQAYLEII